MSSETASKKYRKLKRAKNPVSKHGPPNRKAAAKLEARVKDYFSTTSDSKKNWSGYKKPGSMQGPR